MSTEHDQDTTRRTRAREVGLFRYGLIQDALDPALSTKQRGRLVRSIAEGTHPGPFGAPVRVSRASLDRWIRAYRAGGFTALVPAPRRLTPQIPAEVLELAVALKKEAPGRTAAQVTVVLGAHAGWAPSARTLQRHFAALGLSRWRPDGTPPATFGRFEADQPNARWVGDALHGPVVAGRKAILIAFLDDHSRAVVAARWGYAETAVALAETLRVGLAARGRPAQVYVEGGSMFIDAALRRACAVLGIRLTHSQPGQPAGRGKIERFFRTVRDQFLVEITDGADGTGTAVGSLAELNALFTAWVEQVYHPRVHSETQMAPLARFPRRRPTSPDPRRADHRGVPLERVAHRHQDRDGLLARQPLRGRPGAGRGPGGAGLRPVRPHRHRRGPPRPGGRAGRAVPDRAPRPPQSPHRHRTGGDPDRHRLPAPDRGPSYPVGG